jgi:tetratricopeptide (TPR) repeat protein
MPANYYGPVIYETTYVTTSYPSETATPAPVATSSSLPSDEPSFASARELTPEEQGRRYVEYGDYYFAEGRYRDAADAYGKARTLLPADASLHFVMADAEFALADYHFAAFLIGEGIRLEPGLARAENDKRLLYREPKDFEDQMAALRRYLEAKPYDAMAQFVLAYNLKFSLQPEKALVAFRRVLEIDPSNVAARTFVEALTTPLPGAEDTADAPAAVGGTIEIRDEM